MQPHEAPVPAGSKLRLPKTSLGFVAELDLRLIDPGLVAARLQIPPVPRYQPFFPVVAVTQKDAHGSNFRNLKRLETQAVLGDCQQSGTESRQVHDYFDD